MSTPAPTDPTPIGAREQRLVAVLGRAGRRSGRVAAEQWLFVAGGALVLVGIVLVIIGWVGTSRTVLVAGQIPYVVSGGLLGLGLIFLGGFLYFGYWLALLVRDGRTRRDEDEADLTRVATSLERANATLERIADLLLEERAPARRQRRA
ncbi:MAG: hypothetical protein JO265_15250 [Acidimicrobiia bacterium]|nr:hypothetical protein [Acidimicrobiia bacterium]